MNTMRMPTFLVLGAQKAGTTSLYHYLRQHPEVFMASVKEPNFFAFEGEELRYIGPGGAPASVNGYSITDLETYRTLFDKAGEAKARGEASTLYLYLPSAADRIRHYVPDARLIAVLRNPVERAYASYMHCIRDDREPLEFASALRAEQGRIADHWGFLWHYTQVGRYPEQLRRFFDRFPREQVRVHLYDDFRRDPVAVVQDVYAFIGVDTSFAPDTALVHNASGVPKSRALARLLSRPHAIKRMLRPLVPEAARNRMMTKLKNRNLSKRPIDPEIRRELIEVFRTDIEQLQDMIGRDLTMWLQ